MLAISFNSFSITYWFWSQIISEIFCPGMLFKYLIICICHKSILKNTIDVIQGLVLDTMKEREEYHSKRKSIIAKYSYLTKKL